MGNGIGGFEFPVPDFVGNTYKDGLRQLDSSRLIMGALVVDADVKDTANAFIYQQSPSRIDFEEKKINRIRQGQAVDFWLSSKPPVKKTDSTIALPQ